YCFIDTFYPFIDIFYRFIDMFLPFIDTFYPFIDMFLPFIYIFYYFIDMFLLFIDTFYPFIDIFSRFWSRHQLHQRRYHLPMITKSSQQKKTSTTLSRYACFPSNKSMCMCIYIIMIHMLM
ncbi:MAG: hypothetical protein ACRCWQ_06415, partial [Bacilli bacterium]